LTEGHDGMTSTGIHIAALFETTAAARAARGALVAAGVDAGSILVLDRGNPATATKRGIWATVKHTLVPDEHAHPYAEGVSRGHPLVIADVTEAQREAAEAALQASHPINIETRAQAWEDAGWDGVHEGEEAWEISDDKAAAGSEGITASGIMSGDYGAVGAPRDGKVSLDITRGRFRTPAAPADGELVNDDPKVRVYKAG
jgi:hypothetical protein